MKEQFYLFLTALTFYTRIPSPINYQFKDDYLNRSTRFFPIIGWIVASISFASLYIGYQLFSLEISVCLSIMAGMLTTGAFHEDGLADFFDGFGGGWEKEKILEIMKDSRVGTYGMIATFCILFVKYLAILQITKPLAENNLWHIILFIFITYHSLARCTAIQLSFILPYVREDLLSKVKPIAKEFSMTDKISVFIIGILPLLALSYFQPYFLITLIPLVLTIIYFKYYLQKWIGGYTGDCLGAVEQIAESIILLSILSIWKFM